MEAYEELGTIFKKCTGPNDHIFREYFETVKRLPSEGNAAACESAINALYSYVDLSDYAIKYA